MGLALWLDKNAAAKIATAAPIVPAAKPKRGAATTAAAGSTVVQRIMQCILAVRRERLIAECCEPTLIR
jgi:hypothetical protein